MPSFGLALAMGRRRRNEKPFRKALDKSDGERSF
jgi:hypothetical protein